MKNLTLDEADYEAYLEDIYIQGSVKQKYSKIIEE